MTVNESKRSSRVAWVVVLLAVSAVAILFYRSLSREGRNSSNTAMAQVPARYQANRAMRYLQEICDIGSRVTGSEGMERQREYLAGFFVNRELWSSSRILRFGIQRMEKTFWSQI